MQTYTATMLGQASVVFHETLILGCYGGSRASSQVADGELWSLHPLIFSYAATVFYYAIGWLISGPPTYVEQWHCYGCWAMISTTHLLLGVEVRFRVRRSGLTANPEKPKPCTSNQSETSSMLKSTQKLHSTLNGAQRSLQAIQPTGQSWCRHSNTSCGPKPAVFLTSGSPRIKD